MKTVETKMPMINAIMPIILDSNFSREEKYNAISNLLDEYVSKWISTEDRLPEVRRGYMWSDEVWIVVEDPKGNWVCKDRCNHMNEWENCLVEVKLWQPVHIPELPKELNNS